MKRLLAPALLAVLVMPACAHIDYVGRSYAPTQDVELFLAESDVDQPYEVMGEVLAHANDIVSSEKLQAKIVKKAREKGADAVVITGLERTKTGEHTTYSETSKEKRSRVETSGESSTSDTNEKVIRAIFLKYKDTGTAREP